MNMPSPCVFSKENNYFLRRKYSLLENNLKQTLKEAFEGNKDRFD